MRITGGTARGRILRAPRGSEIRPTSDKVRAAIYNVIAARYDLAGQAVLDLFAGTGALGIEALSRGAERVVFVDASPIACRWIRVNLEETEYASRSEVRQARLPHALEGLRSVKPFAGALLDPPYDRGLGEQALGALAAGTLLSMEAWIVVEHRHGEKLPERSGRFVREALRRYGDTEVSLYVGGTFT